MSRLVLFTVLGVPAAATIAFAANAYKENQIFPPPSNPEASRNKNSSAHCDLCSAVSYVARERASSACSF